MTDLLAEVDDMMRRERMEAIWREHRYKIIGFFAAIILITGLWSGYNSWNAGVQKKNTDALIILIEDPQFPANLTPEKLPHRADARGVTLLIAAKASLAKGNEKESLALYEQLAKDRAISSDLRQLGTLMKVRLQANAKDADAAALKKELGTIYRDNGSPWRYHARLDAAVLTASLQDYEGARDLLAPVLKEEQLPKTFAAKALALDHLYALRAATKG